jgi:hypothetical protein
MHEPSSRYNVPITVAREDGWLPDPASFAAAAERAAWRRSASIVSAHTADQIISVVTVHAPGWYPAVAIARAVISDALKHLAPAPSRQEGEAGRPAAAPRPSVA